MDITRRELIGYLPLSLLGLSWTPSFSFVDSLIDFDVFNLGCIDCKISFCICKKWGVPVPSIANTYWIPVGFIEINRKCQFLTSLLPIVGQVVGNALSSLCALINGTAWIQNTDMSQNTGIGKMNQQYMRVHARWYGLTPDMEAFIRPYVSLRCPCAIFEVIKKVFLGPIYDQLETFEEKVAGVEEKIGKSLKLDKVVAQLDKVREVLDNLIDAKLPLPVWFTEILSPIWLIEFLSPDNVFMGSVRTAIVQSIAQATGPAGRALMCSGVLQKLERLGISIQGMLDPEFFCVGLWGYGYPRIGVVRNDDPLIAHLLAASRFHHLFSKTLPVIPYEFSFHNIKYQLVKPYLSRCWTPGCGGYEIPNFCELANVLDNPSSAVDVLKEKIVALKGRLQWVGDRKSFLVVWKKEKVCCGC